MPVSHLMQNLAKAVFLLLIWTNVEAQITFVEPQVVSGKPTCEKGFFLFSNETCISNMVLTQYSATEVVEAFRARKDPEATKKIADRLAEKKANGIPVFKTILTEENGQIFKLLNNAVVEAKYGYVGYIGYGKKILLFREGPNWKIWIEGKKTFNVEVIRAPSMPATYVTTISEILELIE